MVSVVIGKGSIIDLLHSALCTTAQGYCGIRNLGGEILCHTIDGCVRYCTACLSPTPQQPTTPTPPPTAGDEVVPSLSPTTSSDEKVAPSSLPTLQPSVAKTGSKQSRRSWSQNIVPWYVSAGLVCVLGLGVVMLGLGVVVRRYRMLCCVRPNPELRAELQFATLNPELVAEEDMVLPVLQLDGTSEPEPSPIEFASHSTVMKSYEVSPAPVFVVNRSSMRITLWSPGMMMASPMLTAPLGCLLSELPFVNAIDGERLHRALVRFFDENDDVIRTVMLHLRAQGGHVLLEMVATKVFATESEPSIVLTGRKVDCGLAGLMACASAVASSERSEGDEDDSQLSAYCDVIREDDSQRSACSNTIHDDTMSGSQITGEDNDLKIGLISASESNISSITAPSGLSSCPSGLSSESYVSSITAPSSSITASSSSITAPSGGFGPAPTVELRVLSSNRALRAEEDVVRPFLQLGDTSESELLPIEVASRSCDMIHDDTKMPM